MPRRLEAEKRWSQALIEGTWQEAFWTRELSADPRRLVLEETREAHGSSWRGLLGAPLVDESEALAFRRFACVPGMLHEITGGTGPVEALEPAIRHCDALTSRWLTDLVAAPDEAVAGPAAPDALMGSITSLFDGAFRATNPRLEVVHWGSLRDALSTRQDHLVRGQVEAEGRRVGGVSHRRHPASAARSPTSIFSAASSSELGDRS